ncbi:MAG: hypothetical protein KDB27_12220 [Planctomycetales bacterium]|nr:hypothetical protein [Planctomycetales bacterium]
MDTIAAGLPNETTVSKLADLIRADIAQMEAALSRDKASEYTAQLAQRDQVRDDAFVALRDFAKANSNRSNPEISRAGMLVYSVFETRGLTLYSKGYTEQSADMNLLLEDLSTEETQDALDVMGGTTWYDELRLAQDSFEQLVRDKLSTEAQDTILPTRTSRLRLTDHIETLLGCVRAVHDVEAQATTSDVRAALDELINSVNEIIVNAMTIARARQTRSASVDEHKEVQEVLESAGI